MTAPWDPDITVVQRTCRVCGYRYQFPVPTHSLTRWLDGEPVQRAFPEAPPDWREQLMTGTHPSCWDRLFQGVDL